MKLKILWMRGSPDNHGRDELIRDTAKLVARPDSQIDIIRPQRGPPGGYIESFLQMAISVPEYLKMVEKEKNNYDAIIIGCGFNPGLDAAREISDTPVVGIGEAALILASILGYKFSIIAPSKKCVPIFSNMILAQGLRDKVASIRPINMSVLDIVKNREKAMSTIFEEAQKAVEEDDAEVIILGCGFMTGAVTKLQKKLGVPIVDPVIAGIKVAEMLAELHRKIGLTHSKVCAYHPLEKFDCSP